MTNAQSNLAALGTKPVQFNLGEIYLNQMNYLAKTKGEEEAARAKARAERDKEANSFSATAGKLEYKNQPDYVLYQYNKEFKNSIEDNARVTREYKAGLIDEAEATRQYAINRNIPEQIAALADTMKSSYEQMKNGEGDPLLNEERFDRIKDITTNSGFSFTRMDDGSLGIVTRDRDGNEKKSSASQFALEFNVETPYYPTKSDTNKLAEELAKSSMTVKRGDGTYLNESIKWDTTKPNVVNAIKSSIGTDFNSWHQDYKAAYYEMYGKNENGKGYKRPATQEDVDKFAERFANERVKNWFKEVDTQTTEYRGREKIDLDIATKKLDNENKKTRNARDKVALRKDLREEADETGANTKVEVSEIFLDSKTNKDRFVKTALFTPAEPIQYKVGDKEGGAIYDISSFHVDRDGNTYVPNDQIGISQNGLTMVNRGADQAFIANATKIGTGEEMRRLAKNMINKKFPQKPETRSQKAKDAVVNGVNKIKTFAGNTNKPKTVKVILNGKVGEIPADKVSALLKKYPKAKRL